MSYKKRVIIFFSTIGGLFILLSIFYVIQVVSNIEKFNTESLDIKEFKNIKDGFRSNIDNRFEFE